MTAPTIVDFCKLLKLALSPAQETILRAYYALPPRTDEQRALFTALTQRTAWPVAPCTNLVVIAGRGSGKDSRLAIPIVLFEALFGGHESAAIGEQPGTCVLVAQNERAARGVALRYLKDYLRRAPILSSRIADVLSSSVTLTSGLSIECMPSTSDAPRGYAMPVAVLDEIGVWRLEGSADSDTEILAAIQPRADKIVMIGTPFLMSGVLYEQSKRFGMEDPDTLIVVAPTAVMVPHLAAKLDKRRALMDPTRARREFDAEFIAGLGAFLDQAHIAACVRPGVHEVGPEAGRKYVAALDLSGGRKDLSTLVIVHVDGETVFQDVLRAWDGATPRDALVAQAAALLARYGGERRVHGDNFGANWVIEAFEKHNVKYLSTSALAGAARLTRSDAYIELEPLVRAQRCRLLDDPAQTREFVNLVRRDLPGGRFAVDHPSGGHDDRANACALAMALADRARRKSPLQIYAAGGPKPTARTDGDPRARPGPRRSPAGTGDT